MNSSKFHECRQHHHKHAYFWHYKFKTWKCECCTYLHQSWFHVLNIFLLSCYYLNSHHFLSSNHLFKKIISLWYSQNFWVWTCSHACPQDYHHRPIVGYTPSTSVFSAIILCLFWTVMTMTISWFGVEEIGNYRIQQPTNLSEYCALAHCA